MISSLSAGMTTTSPIIDVVRVLLCIDLLFTAPIMLAVARGIIEASFIPSRSVSNPTRFVERFPETTRNLLRVILVAAISSVAYIVYTKADNAFYNVVSLVGVVGFAIGLVPCLVHYCYLFQFPLRKASSIRR